VFDLLPCKGLVNAFAMGSGTLMILVEHEWSAQLRAIEILDLVPRDAEYPGPQRRGSPVPVKTGQGGQKHLLHHVLDEIRPWNETTLHVCVDGVDMVGDKLGRGLAVLPEDGCREFPIGVRPSCWRPGGGGRCRRGSKILGSHLSQKSQNGPESPGSAGESRGRGAISWESSRPP